MTKQTYLNQQYGTTNNLQARIAIHERFSTNPQDWMEWLFNQFELPTDAHVLELGGGTGRLWQVNRDRIGANWRILYSDGSAGMVAQAQQTLGDDTRFGFAQIDAHTIPFADATFDAVIANHMLYHVENKIKALYEIKRVLKPNGVLYAATNGTRHMQELHELAPDIDIFGMDASFELANGAEILRLIFEQVETRLFDCNLAVTEVEPILDYLRSIKSFDQAQIQTFTQRIRQTMQANNGIFHITKEAGVLIAR